VADSLLDEGAFDHERRWVIVAPEPCSYLADWVAAVVARAYKKAAGTPRARAKGRRKLEESLKSQA
jgi:hypothetical protein